MPSFFYASAPPNAPQSKYVSDEWQSSRVMANADPIDPSDYASYSAEGGVSAGIVIRLLSGG